MADLLLPPACAGCGELLARGVGEHEASRQVCPLCLTRLRAPSHPRCRRCQAPRGTGISPDRECNECRRWPEVLTSSASAVLLAPPADALVRALKYGGWRRLSGDLGRKMIPLVSEGPATASVSRGSASGDPLLVPVPTTPGRLRRRGYNQARLLASHLAAGIGAPLVDALRRRDGGRTQVGLRPDERWSNVEKVFSVTGDGAACAGHDVVLVDDVLTTGATASAAAEALADAGARHVRLVTFARSLPEFV